jgi:hypothetical protein
MKTLLKTLNLFAVIILISVPRATAVFIALSGITEIENVAYVAILFMNEDFSLEHQVRKFQLRDALPPDV